jgi:hypothetical protein
MNNEEKLREAKKKIDAMSGLPNMALRKGVARNGDPLTGFVDYNWKLLRDKETRRYTAYVEWVDLDGEGFRVVLPHEVCSALFRGNDSLMELARKERARTAAETRKSKKNQPEENKE